MQIVQDKVLYHINSKGSINTYKSLVLGDIIDTNNKFNPFRNSYETGVASIGAYWRFTKELAIEQTRIDVDKELPSRWNCIWLSDEEHLPYWEKEVHNNNFQKVKMKLNGKLFVADSHWLELQPCPLIKVRSNAEYYWRGDFFRPGKKEYLFEGSAEVIEIL